MILRIYDLLHTCGRLVEQARCHVTRTPTFTVLSFSSLSTYFPHAGIRTCRCDTLDRSWHCNLCENSAQNPLSGHVLNVWPSGKIYKVFS